MLKRILKYAVIIVIVLVLAGVIGYRINVVRAKQNSVTVSVPVQSVQVKEVGTVKKDNYLELYGNIDSVDKTVVSSKVAGKVSSVAVDNGQSVEAGQTVVSLEDQDYRNLLATNQDTLQKAQLNLNNLQADYERYQKLAQAGAMSQQDLDKAKLAVEVAQADLNSAQVGVVNAQENVNDTVITAPAAGVVVNKSVNVGQMVAAGTPLMTVADISSVYALVNVKQDDINKLSIGMPAQVFLSDGTQTAFQGEVSEISPIANSAARVFEVKIKLDNNDGLLKPGMFVKTRITLSAPTNVLAVPQYALSGSENAYYVFVADGSRAKQQPVKIGSVLGDMVEITSGLKSGDKVITTNINKLNDGDQIAVVGQ